MDIFKVNAQINSIVSELETLRQLLTDGEPVFPKEAEVLIRSRLCLNCQLPLGDGRVIRGCHEACQKAIKRSIDRGELTDGEAVSRGLMATPDSGGRQVRKDTKLGVFLAEKQAAAEASAVYEKGGKASFDQFRDQAVARRKLTHPKKSTKGAQKGGK